MRWLLVVVAVLGGCAASAGAGGGLGGIYAKADAGGDGATFSDGASADVAANCVDACKSGGMCSQTPNGQCEATTDADCRASDGCKLLAKCVVQKSKTGGAGTCGVAFDADCAASSLCPTANGQCSVWDGKCITQLQAIQYCDDVCWNSYGRHDCKVNDGVCVPPN